MELLVFLIFAAIGWLVTGFILGYASKQYYIFPFGCGDGSRWPYTGTATRCNNHRGHSGQHRVRVHGRNALTWTGDERAVLH